MFGNSKKRFIGDRINRADLENMMIIEDGGVDTQESFIVVGVNGKAYNVKVEESEITGCTCPDFQYRGRAEQAPCKHMLKVAEREYLPINIEEPEVSTYAPSETDRERLTREITEDVVSKVREALLTVMV